MTILIYHLRNLVKPMSENIMNKKTERNKQQPAIFLTPDQEDLFISFIHNRVGILIKRDHKEFLRTIHDQCKKLNISAKEYLELLKQADDNSELLAYLVSCVTIGETYFFRDKRQVKLLTEVILPNLIETKLANNDRSLRIWSAGCSSGEEIYTIIMILKDLLPDFKNWQCYFLATDINIDSLRKGLSGNYTEWSMRSIPEFYLSTYFTKVNNSYKLNDDIKKLVSFDYLNLNTDSYPSILNGTIRQDLILCRNVLIYFDNEHIKRILERLSKCINDQGYILLGASDPIALMDSGVKSVTNYPSLFIKKPQSLIEPLPEVKQVYLPEVSVPPVVNNESVKSSAAIKPTLNLDNTQTIERLLQSEQWSEVIFKVDQESMIAQLDVTHLVAKSVALASLGKTIEAIKSCEEAIALDKMNKEAYFIYALSLSELNRYKEAENAFRKALYIDPDFLVCRYQFGLFLIRIKRKQEGLKALESTVNYASQFDDDSIVPNSRNMSYKELVSALKNEIELYQ